MIRVYINSDPEPLHLESHQWPSLLRRWEREERIVTVEPHQWEPLGSSERDRWYRATVTPAPDRPLDGEIEVPHLPWGTIRVLADP